MKKKPERSDSGRKPAVAFKNNLSAEKNIAAKLDLLQSLLMNRPLPVGLPESLRHFHTLWKPVGLDGIQLRTNGPATEAAKKYREAIITTIGAVSEARKEETKSLKKPDSASKLRKAAKLERVMRKVAERTIVKQRLAVDGLMSQIKVAESKLNSHLKESAAAVAALRSEIALVKRENAELTEALARVSPMRVVK